MHKALRCEAAEPRLHGKHSSCVCAPVVYWEAPSVFITLSFPRVASVNKQVLVDAQLILHWNVYFCRRRNAFFLSSYLLFLHLYSISIMLQCISCVFLRCTTPRATTSSDKEPPETLFISLAKARWRFSHITGTRYQCWFFEMKSWSSEPTRSLFSSLLFFILPLSFQWTICQVKVMEKKSGQEEPAVLSRLTERQWFGEKALWGWGGE